MLPGQPLPVHKRACQLVPLLQGCNSAHAPWRPTPHGAPHTRRPHLLVLVSSRLGLRVVLVPETPACWATHVSLSVLAP